MPYSTIATTSVVLIPTATSNAPFFVYLNNVSTSGRIVTVRDNDGFASVTNQIVITASNGAYFQDGSTSITINQPFGYVTFTSALDGGYGVLNTFGFPTGSSAAFVSNITSCNLTTSTIGAQYISAPTSVFNTVITNTVSTSVLFVNNFSPSLIQTNTISSGVITGGSSQFQTLYGSTITANTISLSSLTATNINVIQPTSTINTNVFISTNVGQAVLGVVGPSNGLLTSTIPGDTVLTTARTSNRLVFGNGSTIGITLSNSFVGIGNTSPSYRLDVNGETHSEQSLLIGNTSNNSGTLRITTASGTCFIQPGSNATTGSGTSLVFGTFNNSAETMRINVSTQRVGIGSQVPTTLLHIAGGTVAAGGSTQFVISGTGATPNTAMMLSNSSGEAYFGVSGGSGQYMAGTLAGDVFLRVNDTLGTQKLLLGNGNGTPGFTLSNNFVGINNTSPSYRLDVNGETHSEQALFVGNTNNNSGTLRIVTGLGDCHIQPGSNITSGSGTSVHFSRMMTTTTTMTVNVSTQRVGIGTTTPSYTLDVQGNGTMNCKQFTMATSGSDGIYMSTLTNGYPLMRLDGGNSYGFLFNAFQALGDGISLTYNYYDSNSGVAIPSSGGGTTAIRLGYGTLSFQTDTPGQARAPPERMTITPAGNVGIGITLPAVQLDLSTDGARKLTTTTWTTGSDERIKKNIQLANTFICYSTLKQIPLKYFEWNIIDQVQQSTIGTDDKHSLGFIAQDVETVFPNAVKQTETYGFSNFRSLNVDQLFKMHYGATQHVIQTMEQQSTIIQSLTTQVAELQASMSTLLGRLAV